MNLDQLKSSIQSARSEGKVDSQSVEFIVNTKKHFLKEPTVVDRALCFQVTRENYRVLSIQDFEALLGDFSTKCDGSKDVVLGVDGGDASMKLGGFHLSDRFMEITLAE